MLGETFSWHASFQKFSIKNLAPSHPSMKGVPSLWTKEDECYFGKDLYPGIQVLMAHDLSSLDTTQKAMIIKMQAPLQTIIQQCGTSILKEVIFG